MNTIEKQIELLKLCNDKGLNMLSWHQHELIEVSKFEDKDLVFFERAFIIDGNLKKLDELIEKVKNYK